MQACPLCSSEHTALRWSGVEDRLFRTTDERFDLGYCQDCKATFMAPIPALEELVRYYPENYWVGPTDRGERESKQGVLLEKYRRFVLRDHKKFICSVLDKQRARGQSVRMIDIGCGDGSLLDAVGEPSSMGMDLSLEALRAVADRGFPAVRGVLTDCPLQPGTFSLVTAHHFLEHVHPVEPILRGMRDLLAPGGEIILQVPNTRCWQARLLRRRWAGFEVPRHLINYDDRTLCTILERNGFEVLAENHHCLRDNPTTLANSLVPGLFPPGRVSRGGVPTGFGALLANLMYLGVTVASMPLAFVESLFRRGASIMVHARPTQHT